MNKQSIVKVLNELGELVFERGGGVSPFALIEDTPGVRIALRVAGVTDEQIDGSGTAGEYIDLHSLGFKCGISIYENGKFVLDDCSPIQGIEVALGRPLTEEERHTLAWLAGWPRETNEVIHGLLLEMWRAGQADAEAAREVVEGV